jgi:tRNA(fMet)-specific endonuclease VapC
MASDGGYLLDTNVVVALVRNNQLGQHIDQRYELSTGFHRSAISIVTVGEMYSLASQFGWGQQKQTDLQAILDEIVWIDINHHDVLQAYGEIDAASKRDGNAMGKNDVWIAATAKASRMTLLTTDRDFDYAHPRFVQRIWIDPESAPPE